MARTYVPVLIALSAVAVLPSLSLAQGTATQGSVGGDRGIENCVARAGGSRMRTNNCVDNRSQSQTVRTEHELTVKVDLPAADGPQCEASALTEYMQRNATAQVKGTVSISSCPAGTTGKFTLAVRVRDEAGETKLLEFNETWQHDDARDYVFNAAHPIGDNVELMSVRVRNLSCTCAEAGAAAPAVLETAPPPAEPPVKDL